MKPHVYFGLLLWSPGNGYDGKIARMVGIRVIADRPEGFPVLEVSALESLLVQ